MFLINKKTGLLVRGVRMLHSHSVDEGAFDREGRLLTFKIDVHDKDGTLIGYTDSEGNDCGAEDTELVDTPPEYWTDGQGG
jgi:hypothetical protein